VFIRPHVKTFVPSKVSDSGARGIILHFQDIITPRPVDHDQRLKITYQSPKFEGHDIFGVSPIHTLMVLRVKSTVYDIDFEEDTPIVRVSWDN
jgi:hypothetical protein